MSASPPIPKDEPERLAALLEYKILDTPVEQAFQEIVELACRIFKTPIALVSLVDAGRQWFKAKEGLPVSETPREHAFCAHAINKPTEVMVVADAQKDTRFVNNPLVLGDPHIRFYAGAPLVTPTGHALGTLCVIDRQKRQMSEEEEAILRGLSHQVIIQLELRRSLAVLENALSEREQQVEQMEHYQRSLENSQAQLLADSLTDALTALNNRRAFEARLKEEFSRARRESLPLSLLMLDVDHFKSYNDNFGHPAGDDVLKAVGGLLRDAGRPYDFPARYGGEEFVVILPATPQGGALVVAERIRRNIHGAVWQHRTVTVSVGLALDGPDITCPEDLLKKADLALYQAKKRGRNRVSFSAPDMVKSDS